jgi:hypothetical protein
MAAAHPDDAGPQTRPTYLYSIRHVDQASLTPLFLTDREGGVTLEDLPASYGGTDPQEFAYARIGHGRIAREGNFDKSTFQVQIRTAESAGLSRYALTGAIPRIKVTIIKVNPGPVDAGENAVWGDHTIVVQSGLLASFAFQGFDVVAECVPEPLISAYEIPRWRFSRTCNHQLYGPGCELTAEDWSLSTNIVTVDPVTRQLLVTGQHIDETGNYFRQGVCQHQPTGSRLSIFASATEGADTLITLNNWSPDLAPGHVVNLLAGCDHRLTTCRDKFLNAHNFGGFATIPEKNPSLHSL